MLFSSLLVNPGNTNHHSFLKRPFLSRSARVRRFSRYEVSPHIPEHSPFRVQTQLLHIIPHTFSPSLSAPTRTSQPCHHHICRRLIWPLRGFTISPGTWWKYFEKRGNLRDFFCDVLVHRWELTLFSALKLDKFPHFMLWIGWTVTLT